MFAMVEFVLVPLVFLLFVPIIIVTFAFWIWMLIHAIQNKGLSDGEKIAWVIVLVFVHFLGALLYFFIGRPKAKQPLLAT